MRAEELAVDRKSSGQLGGKGAKAPFHVLCFHVPLLLALGPRRMTDLERRNDSHFRLIPPGRRPLLLCVLLFFVPIFTPDICTGGNDNDAGDTCEIPNRARSHEHPVFLGRQGTYIDQEESEY